MKQVFIMVLLGLACWIQLPAQGLFSNIHGNPEDNFPTAVKAFGDGLYVSGYRIIGGAEYGTFTKFDLATGNFVWTRFVELQSRLVDFEYDAANDEFLVIGYSYPFSASFDNRSILLKIDDSGNQVFSRLFNQPGRDLFERIVLHPNPINPNFPYYISGVKNATTTPSSDDVVVLYNIDAAGTVNWAREYAYSANPTDDEFQRGLIAYTNNSLILTGNVTNNDGMLVQVSGLDGSVINSVRIALPLDINNGKLLPNNMLALVGEDYSNVIHDGFVLLLNANLSVVARYRFDNILSFKDIWLDQFNRLYTVGKTKTTPTGINYPVIHRLLYSGIAPFTITVDWSKYIDETGPSEYYINFAACNMSVTPSYDRIFYADSRMENGADPTPSGFGGQDLLVGSFDLDLTTACAIDIPSPTSLFGLQQFNEIVSSKSFTEPNPATPPILQPFPTGTNVFCEQAPCECDFVWKPTNNCWEMEFTATCTPAQGGVYTYAWDFDCTGPLPPQVVNVAAPTHTITHQFPCGGGTFNVCLQVTQPNGTICNLMHQVTVPDSCCGQASGSLTCHPGNPYKYDFTINVTPPSNTTGCAYTLTSAFPLSNVVYSAGTITGCVSVTDPVPLNLGFTLVSNCVCIGTGLPVPCTQQLSLPTKCCKEIYVPDVVVCENDATLDVPIQVLNGAVLNNITKVEWFILPKPSGGCPASYWGGVPYQSDWGSTLKPLHLLPAFMNGDYCVYAVVMLNDGPCTQIFSNIAMVQFCATTTCSLTIAGPTVFCYSGTPIVPGLLTAAFNVPANACTLPLLQWINPDGSPGPSGGSTYQPTVGLVMSDPANDCYEDFVYTLDVTDACGTHSCQLTVRLHSDNGPDGTLTIRPPDAPPLCPGQAVILDYMPECADDPPGWTWYSSTTGPPPPAQIPGAGTSNTVYYTNNLNQTTWFMVEKMNGPGVCPNDQVHLKVDVRDPLAITNFQAEPVPVCDPTGVQMTVDFKPLPPDPTCSVTVEWYKDGNLVGVTSPPASSPSSFTYTPLPPLSIEGNYYCIIKNDCCDERDTSQVVVIDPPCFAEIIGPCFMCNTTPVMLSMIIYNLPPTTNCTYQWTTVVGGNIISPANQMSITVDGWGYYCCTATCTDINNNVCTKTQCFNLAQCFFDASGCHRTVDIDDPVKEPVQVLVFPNPTTGTVTLEIGPEPLRNGQVRVVDFSGRLLFYEKIPPGQDNPVFSLAALPSGLYFIQVLEDGVPVWVGKVVRQ
ncbi:MAG: T9SS type A sorting domain-containing protein [Lewinellaceae bacterium]|nr:T9SS type A sorting domain-containing protein [Lewinellaceae bacterium]